jgi:hypothetical protein
VTTRPAPAPRRAPVRDAVLAWADPEWLPLLTVLLLPAAACAALGDGRKAGFFLGTAVYVTSLKWLGWALLGRRSAVRPACLLFAAEVFLGLAVACAWFYLRNLLARVWPASYSLVELRALFPVLLLLHGAGVLLRGWPEPGWRRPWLERAAVYAPFVAALTVALWQIGGALGVQGTDGMNHVYMARVYRDEGIEFRVPPAGLPLAYPGAFAAMNAVASAVAPLSVVQAFHLQHVLLCVLSLFLVTGAVAALAGRPLKVLHSLPLPFLFVFPLYALYPDLFYPGTPKQACVPLLSAICLVPLLAPTAGRAAFLAALAGWAVLPALVAALNPACAPYAAAATLIGLGVAAARGKSALGVARWRVVAWQTGLLLAAAALVLGNDAYYSRFVRSSRGEPPAARGEAVATVGKGSLFSATDAARAAGSAHPLGLSPAVSVTAVSAHYDYLKGWDARALPRSAAVAALAVVLLALLLMRLRRKRVAPSPAERGVAFLGLGLLLLWLPLKYGVTFLAGGLSLTDPLTFLLHAYARYVLLRCELLLVFAMLAAGASLLFLAVERRASPKGRRGTVVLAGLAAACWLLPLAGALGAVGVSGLVTVPTTSRFEVTDDDLAMVAWLDDNIPPEKGQVALAGFTFRCGPHEVERHVYPLGPGHALPVYGRHYNYRFFMPFLEKGDALANYEEFVRDRFDGAWCRRKGITHFYVPAGGLEGNPGLEGAITAGELREVHRVGGSAVYEVVAP